VSSPVTYGDRSLMQGLRNPRVAASLGCLFITISLPLPGSSGAEAG
jgi:hypothetical protein